MWMPKKTPPTATTTMPTIRKMNSVLITFS
jgi:hypothetical protein